MTDTPTPLEPCPFCYMTREEVITHWNTRRAPKPTPAEPTSARERAFLEAAKEYCVWMRPDLSVPAEGAFKRMMEAYRAMLTPEPGEGTP